jgi:hypothetical protein
MLMDSRRYNLKCFKEILITGCWAIWNPRNHHIFDGEDVAILECFRLFKEDLSLIMHRAKPSLKEGKQQWIDTL